MTKDQRQIITNTHKYLIDLDNTYQIYHEAVPDEAKAFADALQTLLDADADPNDDNPLPSLKEPGSSLNYHDEFEEA